MATITKTVKASGGDYTSLSAWESAEQTNLVTDGDVHVVECDDFQQTAALVIDGWTTGVSNFITVKPAAGQEHSGIRGTGPRIVASSLAFQVNESYTVIEGFSVSTSGSDQSGFFVDGSVPQFILFDRCIAYDCTGNGFLIGEADTTMRNCVAVGCTADGLVVYYGYKGGTILCENMVAIANGGMGFDEFANTLAVKNCYAGGNTGVDFDSGLTMTTCHAEDGTGDTTTAYSTSSGAYFTNVTAGSEDVHIASASSALIGAATDLSGDFTLDFDRETRSAWDVGADEYIAAGGGSLPAIRPYTSRMAHLLTR